MQRKALPTELSFEALFQRCDDWSYFEHSGAFPFADTTEFSPANAWWSIELSMLTYAGEATVRAALGRAGIEDVEIIEHEGTRCVIAGHRVAFRGTSDERDLWLDLDAVRVAEGTGEVHRGFRRALDHVWEELADRLAGRPAHFTGHSLGAALATLAAARHAETRSLFTFGSPRVGDRDFSASLRIPAYRVVNNTDFVPHLPPPLGYAHVGALHHLDTDGVLREGTSTWERLKLGLEGHFAQLQENLRRWRAGDLEALPLASLVDHSPLHYAVHLWNWLVGESA